MAIKFLDNLCVTLTAKLEKSQTNLPISTGSLNKLRDALGDGNYSYLTLVTPLGAEIVKVTNNAGAVAIERAQGGTDALTGGVGKCLCFRVNKLVLDDAGVTSETCVSTIETDQPDYIVITAPDEGKCNWKVNLKQDFLDKILALFPDDDCEQCVIGDGVYENATVTIKGGKVCGIANGKNIVYTGGSSCGCNT